MSTNELSGVAGKVVENQHMELAKPGKAALRIAVLLSGSGSNLQALIDACEGGDLPGVEIALVVSNKANAAGLQRALKHKLPALYMPWGERAETEARLASILSLFQIELVVLAGWLRIFTAEFVKQFPQRMINLHPALLPNDGVSKTYTTSDGSQIPVFRGLHVVEQALAAGIKVTGSTVHYVIPEVDAGPVICREEVAIEEGDTEETLHERVKQVEHRIIVEAVKQYTNSWAWR
jgi:phosphoribosylglycinamide formyltransferase 1